VAWAPIYRGKHVMMEKTVAVKVLRPRWQETMSWWRASRAKPRQPPGFLIHTPLVLPIWEAENGVVFLVMEYLEGRTLKDLIRSEGAMTLDRAVEIVRQVSGALDAAHQQGVIHRDLKSENIMLTQTNAAIGLRCWILDCPRFNNPKAFATTTLPRPIW